MKSSDISVVICTKDRPEMLRRCLQSIAGGSEHPGEVLVIDQSLNGHTADTVRNILAASGLPIRYFHPKSIGQTKARNYGIKSSTGEVIAFTDDDCLADTDWVRAITREFDNQAVGCVCGHTYPADHSDRPRQALLSTLNHRRWGRITGKCNPILIGRGNNMAFRRSELAKTGWFNEQIGVGTRLYAGDDADIFYRLTAAGGSIIHSPYPIVRHAQPEHWKTVIEKKRGYAISFSAVLVSRVRQGDMYAAMLLMGKILYEFGCLMCGGVFSLNRRMAMVGWHSLMGSLSGVKYAFNRPFCDEVARLTRFASKSYSNNNGHH